MKRSHALLLLIFALALVLRTWHLGEVPPGFNQDEAANAFDPLSLWHTGETFTGDRWPLFFDMYGDYNEGLYYYLNLPFYVVLGNDPASARLPIALVGALAVFALYFLVRQAEGRGTALLAALLLAVSPWAILASRITLREMLLPVAWMLGLAYFLRGIQEKRTLAPATFWLALSFYTYTPVRLFVPFMLVVLAVLYRRELFAGRRRGETGRIGPIGPIGRGFESLLLNAGGFLVLMAPFLYWLAFRTSDLLARASAVDIFEPGKPLSAAWLEFARNWLRHYDPRYLFLHGGDEPLFSLPGWGLLFSWTAPFVLLGLLQALWRRRRWDVILLAWMLTYPIADAFTVYAPHPQRAIAGVGLYEILAAQGLVLAFGWLSQRRKLAGALAALLALIAIVQLARFTRQYFGPYPLQYERRYYGGLERIFNSPQLEWDHGVVVSQAMHRGPMQLFYHRKLWGPQKMGEDARNFPMLMRPERARFTPPVHFTWGCFAFGEPFLLDYPGALYVLRCDERGLLPALEIARDHRGVAAWAIVADADLHAHAPWMRDGSPALQLLDVELSRTHAHVGESLAIRYRLARLGESSEPLTWATHFFSGKTLWPHDVAFDAKDVAVGNAFAVTLETAVPEYAQPGEYRVFAGPYRRADGARLVDASGADFHAVGAITVESGSPEPTRTLVWERAGRVRLQMSPLELPLEGVKPGQRVVLTGDMECPAPLEDPVVLTVSFFTAGAEWDAELSLPRGSRGRQAVEVVSRVPRDARKAEYAVHVGLYDPARDTMLLLRDGRTRVDLGRMYVMGQEGE